MMSTADTRTKSHFSYIWTIENFSELSYKHVRSPKFVVKTIANTLWFLEMVECFVFICSIQTDDFSEETRNGIDFEFSFLGADGSPLISKRNSGSNRLSLNLIDRDVFLEKWAEFVPNNALTVQCKMWRRDREIPTDVCYATTRLQTHTGTFIWAIKEFSALRSNAADDFRSLAPNEKKVYPLKPLTKRGPFMALILHLKIYDKSESVFVAFLIEKCRDYPYCCELSILDANGKVVVSKVKRGREYYRPAMLIFPHLISKNELFANKDLFLPNDTLVLRCSFEVGTGVISSEIEYFTPNIYSVAEEEEEDTDFKVVKAETDDSLEFEQYFIKETNQDGE